MGLCTGKMIESIPKTDIYHSDQDKFVFTEYYNDELNGELNDLPLNESETIIWSSNEEEEEEEDNDEYIYNNYNPINPTGLRLQQTYYN